jgi:hypothetical protein
MVFTPLATFLFHVLTTLNPSPHQVIRGKLDIDVSFINQRQGMLDITIEIVFREINEETNKNTRPLATNILGQQNTQHGGYLNQDVREGRKH